MNGYQPSLDKHPIEPYFREMRHHRLLDREEERDLARRYREANDEGALRRLVQGNLRLVVKIAKAFWRRGGVSLMDLIQEGNVGLIHAAKKFDPAKKVKFSYYAGFWIKAYIHKFLMDNYRTVRVGTTQPQRKLFFNLRKTRARLARQGIDPTAEAVAQALKVRPTDVREMQMRLDHPDLSLNAPLHEPDREEQGDRLRSPASSAAERFERRQLSALVHRNTRRFSDEQLDEREKAILDRRILANRPDTLQTLGDRFGVSRERIRQVEKRIIKKLRTYLFEKMPDMRQMVLQ